MQEAACVWHGGNVKLGEAKVTPSFFFNWGQVKKEYILKVVGARGEKDPEVWREEEFLPSRGPRACLFCEWRWRCLR